MTLCLYFFYPASSLTICATEMKTITCYNDSKIFIDSVTYGRTDNVTCLAPNQSIPSCNASIDLSWRVTPVCQGQSSCAINGSLDDQETPCNGNNTSYLNVTYSCTISKLKTWFLQVVWKNSTITNSFVKNDYQLKSELIQLIWYFGK